MQAIHKAIQQGDLNAEIGLVISNKPDASGLRWAEEQNLKTQVLVSKGIARDRFDQALMQVIDQVKPDLICLAGYLRLLTGEFIQHYAGKIVNIHPSLLPSFKGLHAQKQALDYGVKIAGCTVHHVVEEMDAGPIVMQAAVEVKPDDTEESLSARILEQEHRLYPLAIQMVLTSLRDRGF
jgi:phosphoribosylglycinamide formyltransferase 1